MVIDISIHEIKTSNLEFIKAFDINGNPQPRVNIKKIS